MERNDRDRLIKLISEVQYMGGLESRLADHLLANGVTLGKPLVEYLHPIDAYEGLKDKYLVFKADTGEQVVNCFVLRPDKDNTAVEALRFYAYITDNKTLAEDIYKWVGKSKILPPCKVGDIVYAKYSGTNEIEYYVVDEVTHLGSDYFRFEAHLENEDGYTVDTIEFGMPEIGLTIFLTREEAERKLKERDVNC